MRAAQIGGSWTCSFGQSTRSCGLTNKRAQRQALMEADLPPRAFGPSRPVCTPLTARSSATRCGIPPWLSRSSEGPAAARTGLWTRRCRRDGHDSPLYSVYGAADDYEGTWVASRRVEEIIDAEFAFDRKPSSAT
jgi:hypothetical protein